MDIVAIPSHNEAFGLTVIEAMAAGKPIVGASTGAIPEIIDDCGLLADPLSASAIANQLRTLLQAPTMRAQLGQQAHQRAEQAFSISKHLDKLIATYYHVT